MASFSGVLGSSIPLSAKLADRLDRYVNDTPVDNNIPITTKDNVIHFNFKTKGNA